MIGKVPPDELKSHVFSRMGAEDPAVTIGPQYGEDAAVIRLDDRFLVISSDPVSLAAERIGTIGVHVSCNDIAATGADPQWLTSTIFLPGTDGDLLETITAQLNDAARSIGVTIVGGHTEYVAALDRPMLSLTSFGLTETVVPTAGAAPGDHVILTKGAGIEGTAIIATDFRRELAGRVPEAVLDRAARFFDEISVLPDSRLARSYATAMHDPTEGGVIDGLLELALASDVEIRCQRDAISVRAETEQVCRELGVDPLRIFGSGGLLFTVPAESVTAVLDDFEAHSVAAAVIGEVSESEQPGVRVDDTVIREPVRDDLYSLWE